MVRRLLVICLTGAALGGCATHRAATGAHATVEVEAAAAQPTWATFATPAGVQSLDTLHARFTQAVHTLPRPAAARVRAEGALLDPDAAQLAPQLTPGPYHCRLVRIGGARGVQGFAPDVCYILADTDGLAFAKASGENRPEGHLHADGDKRMVLLGTYRRANEKAQHRYGDDPARDIVGVFERVSSFRWRLIIDRAGSLDVYEMVPVPPEVKGAKAMVPQN